MIRFEAAFIKSTNKCIAFVHIFSNIKTISDSKCTENWQEITSLRSTSPEMKIMKNNLLIKDQYIPFTDLKLKLIVFEDNVKCTCVLQKINV